MKCVDLTGKKFNRLYVIEKSESCSSGTTWKCLCDCGKSVIVSACHLKSGHTSSCGCLNQETTAHYIHGHSATKSSTYKSWKEMRQRCKNPKSDKWQWYGGRGITVCDRWDSFSNFLLDMGNRPLGKSIDRIDNDKGYYPENCRWATQKEQTRKQNHCKLSQEIADEIRNNNTFERGYQTEMSIKYGVSKTTINRLIKNETWS